MEPNEVEFDPGAGTVNAGHEGEEVIYILEGRLRVELEGSDQVELDPGDVYTYPATIPHRISAARPSRLPFSGRLLSALVLIRPARPADEATPSHTEIVIVRTQSHPRRRFDNRLDLPSPRVVVSRS